MEGREPREPIDEVELLRLAQDPHTSPFDYVIVGSGAGGGPLAARLALAGRRVLVIEAGCDAAESTSVTHPGALPGEVYGCPGYHAAATEDYETGWQFSVRHYADDARQAEDEKYDRLRPPHPRFLDPANLGGQGRGGILYPRSASLGGCTSHHAMIMAVPNDRDWDYIAELTGDESWRPGQMRGYFARLERCLYRESFLKGLIGRWLYAAWQRLALFFDPRAVLDEGGHGTNGWQPTSFIDPELIKGLKRRDRGFIELLIGAALAVLHEDSRLIGLLKRALVKFRVVQHIDPNDLNTRITSPEGAFLIPTGIESRRTSTSSYGRRTGVREFLLRTREECPGRLVIKQRTHVTRVLFEGEPGKTPRAIGVEAAEGEHLYEASPLRVTAPGARVRYFARREVVLCGGAFNTPQLLMLSGIGDAHELAGLPSCVLHGVTGPLLAADASHRRVDLPGVGRNLQDRYEVSVISELDEEFESLEGATFTPGDATDPLRREWLRTGEGLYRTNGGTLAVLRRSSVLGADDPEPDVFTFGAPAAFRGYYFGWSRELLRRTLGAPTDQRNLWSWIILKAYTRNDAGTVKLRSANPFDQPEICFDSFNEKAELEAQRLAARRAQLPPGAPLSAQLADAIAANERVLADSRRDLAALADTVAFLRRVNARNPQRFVREIQPGPERADGSKELEEWIRTEAWGHHASCTCRMGSDPWREHPAKLQDRSAGLASDFRVHGVKGLRVVDASVFPKIPGYFILTPILMISEKAADVLLAERGDDVYAPAFREREVAAVHARRARANRRSTAADPERAASKEGLEANAAARASLLGGAQQLPPDTVGLALSGGGIRSATFALGVLQAVAERNRLRDVDFLSTVSGGGFIGSFLGRLFTRPQVRESADPVGRVQEILRDGESRPLWWLRTQANYLFNAGTTDLRLNLAMFFRNLLAVHLIVGTLLFAAFGALSWLGVQLPTPPAVRDVPLSPWWWSPLVVLALGTLPAAGAFWLSQRTGSYRAFPYQALAAWVVLLAGALWVLQTPAGRPYAAVGLSILLLAWVWQELARWGAAPVRELHAARTRLERLEKVGATSDTQQEELRRKEAAVRQQTGTIARNRLTRGLGETIWILAALVAFVVLDTFALLFARQEPSSAIAAIILLLAPALPLLRYVGIGALRELSAAGAGRFSLLGIAKLLGIPSAVLLFFAIDVLAHRLFFSQPREARWVLGIAVLLSLVIGRAFSFLNLSSLCSAYAARLSRTFLGASNAARVYASASEQSRDVQTTHPDDDLPHERYHPEANGGPLHLINVCINETVDLQSEREIRERKGLPMCVSPHGVSVGRRHFALWTAPDDRPRWMRWRRWRSGLDAEDSGSSADLSRTALRPASGASDPNAFHVLRSKASESAEAEPLTLGTWIAISGAAFTTGTGRQTSLPLALFMGVLNVRLGYWWDTGILPHERPGRYPPHLWRRLKRLPGHFFAVQSMLLSEWRARFRGPGEWFWYLSDGGHFEVTGAYELLRRRVPFVIVTDAGEDGGYRFEDVAQLTQQVRIDFGAEIEWLAGVTPDVPGWIQPWINAAAVGPLATIARSSAHAAALARVTYPPSNDVSWILLLKPVLGRGVSQDVRNYAARKPEFPQQSTFDQVFDDNQWESYRALGRQIGLQVLS